MPLYEPVPAPPAAAPANGLLATLRPLRNLVERDGKWAVNGVSYEPEGCVEGTTEDVCDTGTELADLTKPDAVEWFPYKLTISETCSTFTNDMEHRAARARRLLVMDTERQLGTELWSGTIAQANTLPDGVTDYPNSWLADPAGDHLTSGGAITPTEALACLEEYLAGLNGGQQGMIHATAQVVTHWAENGLVTRKDDGTLHTLLDTLVVSSPGYPGTSPTGTIGDGNVWAYATDMVRVFLSTIQPFSPEAMTDRRNNTVFALAERAGLAEWQKCRLAGAQIDITPCTIGGSS